MGTLACSFENNILNLPESIKYMCDRLEKCWPGNWKIEELDLILSLPDGVVCVGEGLLL